MPIIDMFWMQPEGVRVWDFMEMKSCVKEPENNRQRKVSRFMCWRLKFYRKLEKFFYGRMYLLMEQIWIGTTKHDKNETE